MNLFEAWYKAEEGQIIKSNRVHYIIKKEGKGDYDFDRSFSSWATCLTVKDMLGDDWEIEKEKKTIVIENVKWYINGYSGLLTPLIDLDIKKQLLNKPPMKMTLEWKE